MKGKSNLEFKQFVDRCFKSPSYFMNRFCNLIIEKLRRTQQGSLRVPSRLARCLSWRCFSFLSRLYRCMYYAGSLYRLTVPGSYLFAFATPVCAARSVLKFYLMAYEQVSKIQSKNTQSTNSNCATITPITNPLRWKCKSTDVYENY